MFEPIVLNHHLADQVAETAKVLDITSSELAEMCIEIVLGQPAMRAALKEGAQKRNRPSLTVLTGGVS